MKDLHQSSAAFDQASTVVCVIERRQNSWLLAGAAAGLKRQPCKKLSTNPHDLLKQIGRWRGETEKAGREFKQVVAAFEAGGDGFWLAQPRHRGLCDPRRDSVTPSTSRPLEATEYKVVRRGSPHRLQVPPDRMGAACPGNKERRDRV